MSGAENTKPIPGITPRQLPEPPGLRRDFDPVAVAKELLRVTCTGTLAIIDRNTGPFASIDLAHGEHIARLPFPCA